MSAGIDSTLPADRSERLEWLQGRALIVGAVALAVCIIGAFFSPTQFFRAYLVAYLFFLGLAHGCFVVLMIYHLTGGAWGFLIRRVLEAGMRTLPLRPITRRMRRHASLRSGIQSTTVTRPVAVSKSVSSTRVSPR